MTRNPSDIVMVLPSSVTNEIDAGFFSLTYKGQSKEAFNHENRPVEELAASLTLRRESMHTGTTLADAYYYLRKFFAAVTLLK